MQSRSPLKDCALGFEPYTEGYGWGLKARRKEITTGDLCLRYMKTTATEDFANG